MRLWRFAASHRLALLWLALMGLILLAMALLPQAPDAALRDPAEMARWLASVRSRLGEATTPLFNLGFLSVRHTPWLRLLLAGAALSLLVRLYEAAEALRQARRLPEAPIPEAQPQRSEILPVAPEQAMKVLAAQLKRRGYRVRTQAGDATYILVADRPLAPLGPLLAHLGLLVILLGAGWNMAAGWEQAGVVLPPQQAVAVGRGPTFIWRLDATAPGGEAQVTTLADGVANAQHVLAPGATRWSGALGARWVGEGLAVQLSGSDASGAPVMLLAAPGAPPTATLTLLITSDRPEPAAFAPAQALALQAEARGDSAVQLRALRGTAGDLVAEEEIGGEGTLTVDDVRYQIKVARYITLDMIYQPGRSALIGGGLLAALGLLVWALYRPRRLWATAAPENGATTVEWRVA
jgi:cytochrome c biogenesis protein ResB